MTEQNDNEGKALVTIYKSLKKERQGRGGVI